MAISIVNICNIALGRIGIDQTIEDIDEGNTRARNCKLFYEQCRNQTLRDFAWNFATTAIALADVAGTPPPGWSYMYRYPIDCERLLDVGDASGIRTSLVTKVGNGSAWPAYLGENQQQPFQVMADQVTTGRIIVTDVPLAYAWYTKRVNDPNQFDSLFISALAWNIAGELALPLKASPALSVNAMKMYNGQKSMAEAASLSEGQEDAPPQSPSIAGRY